MSKLQQRIRERWTIAVALLILVGIGAVALLNLQSPCFVKEWLGMPCPGCGMTRAAHAFLKGDFAGVNHWHPMFWTLFPLLGYFVACVFSRRLREKIWIPLLVFGVAMVACWVIRMILFFPGTPPMDMNPDAWLIQWLW